MNIQNRANNRLRAVFNSIAVLIALIVLLSACSGSQPPPTTEPIIDKGAVANTVRYPFSFDPTPTTISPTLIGQANAMQQVLINVYQRVAPSVVNIEMRLKNNTSGEPDASGSGFVLDTDGHIVTNAHVVEGAQNIQVTFNDGYLIDASIVGFDNYSDLAVLNVKVSKDKLLPVTLGDSTNLKVGQSVVTIGNPFGLLSSMTTGIVSATGRTLQSSQMLNPQNNNQFVNPSIIQIDAQLNPGNSGGPLLDIDGRVIGVNTAIRTETGVFQGIGFAVPINTVKRVVPQLIKTGKADYSWLGIGSSDRLNVAAIAQELQLPVSYGVLVDTISTDSPASVAGLRAGKDEHTIRGIKIHTGGDIIVAINDQSVRDMDALLSYLVANTTPGDVVTLTLIRDNQTIDVKVTLQARPSS